MWRAWSMVPTVLVYHLYFKLLKVVLIDICIIFALIQDPIINWVYQTHTLFYKSDPLGSHVYMGLMPSYFILFAWKFGPKPDIVYNSYNNQVLCATRHGPGPNLTTWWIHNCIPQTQTIINQVHSWGQFLIIFGWFSDFCQVIGKTGKPVHLHP